jgi:hypothetical protein
MRMAIKIVLATGLILGVFWISFTLGAVFILVFLAKTILARGGLFHPDTDMVIFEEDNQDNLESHGARTPMLVPSNPAELTSIHTHWIEE